MVVVPFISRAPAHRRFLCSTSPSASRRPRCSRRGSGNVGNWSVSPERRGAERLRSLFTFVAVQQILQQLQGSGRGDLGAYDGEAYQTLTEHMEAMKLSETSAEEWVRALLAKNSRVGRRVIEVRAHYGENEFEYENLRKLAISATKEANLLLLQEALTNTTSLEDVQPEKDKE